MKFPVTTAALALLVVQPVFPRASEAQEINWQGPLVEDVTKVLSAYYKPGTWPPTLRPGCRADDGEVCFNGDHEDQDCHISRCREPEEVAAFLAKLTEAARTHPGDALVLAQAVYAYTRLGDMAEALALAAECTLASWWCELLLGMVHARAERPREAEDHFRSALSAADPALASRLTGIADLLGDDDRSEYQRLAGRERGDFEQRFWWLTDPMLSIPGNDRWTEHIRRRFELLLHERILEAFALGHSY